MNVLHIIAQVQYLTYISQVYANAENIRKAVREIISKYTSDLKTIEETILMKVTPFLNPKCKPQYEKISLELNSWHVVK